MKRFIIVISLLFCCGAAFAQDNDPFVGDWTGRWSYSKWNWENDTFSLASGYTLVRIIQSGEKYIVRIKEVEDSSEPQITYYLPELKTVFTDETSIEVAYRYAEWGTRKIQLRMREGYISMSSTMMDEERGLTGRMCPIIIARNNSNGYGIIELDEMEELRLFSESNW